MVTPIPVESLAILTIGPFLAVVVTVFVIAAINAVRR